MRRQRSKRKKKKVRKHRVGSRCESREAKSIAEQLHEQRERHRLEAEAAEEEAEKAAAKKKRKMKRNSECTRKIKIVNRKVLKPGIGSNAVLKRQVFGGMGCSSVFACVRQRLHRMSRCGVYRLISGALWNTAAEESGKKWENMSTDQLRLQLSDKEKRSICLHDHKQWLGGPAGRSQSLSSFFGTNRGGVELVARLGAKTVSLCGADDVEIKRNMRVDRGTAIREGDSHSMVLSSAVRHVPSTSRVLWCQSVDKCPNHYQYRSHEIGETTLKIKALDGQTSRAFSKYGMVSGLSVLDRSSVVLTLAQKCGRSYRAFLIDVERFDVKQAVEVERSSNSTCAEYIRHCQKGDKFRTNVHASFPCVSEQLRRSEWQRDLWEGRAIAPNLLTESTEIASGRAAHSAAAKAHQSTFVDVVMAVQRSGI